MLSASVRARCLTFSCNSIIFAELVDLPEEDDPCASRSAG